MDGNKANDENAYEEESWYTTTLPIALSVFLSVILLALIVYVLYDWCKRKIAKCKEKKKKKHGIKYKHEKLAKDSLLLEEQKNTGVSSAAKQDGKADSKRSFDFNGIPYIDETTDSLINLYPSETIAHKMI